MGLFSRKKPKGEKSEGNGGHYADIARDLNRFEEEGNFDKKEDAVLFLTTSKTSGNTLVMGSGQKLSQCLVYAMKQDPNFLELVKKSLHIHDVMSKTENIDLSQLSKDPGSIVDKLKSILTDDSVTAKIVDASDPDNLKEISLNDLENNLKSNKRRSLGLEDLLKDSGIEPGNPDDFNDDIESLGED